MEDDQATFLQHGRDLRDPLPALYRQQKDAGGHGVPHAHVGEGDEIRRPELTGQGDLVRETALM
ncbi:MAG TPA: hypothetical protein VFN47_02445 [Pedococcus sp.]|nr:hypothetical protein [Pedococcus sp.]